MNFTAEYIFGITNLADTERIIDDHTRIRKRILGIIIDQDDENPKFFDGTPADYALYTALTSNISYSFPSPCIAFTETGIIRFLNSLKLFFYNLKSFLFVTFNDFSK